MSILPKRARFFPTLRTHISSAFIDRGLIIWITSLLIGFTIIIYPYLPRRWGLAIICSILCIFSLLIIRRVKLVMIAVILIDIPLRWDVYLGARVQQTNLGWREGWMLSISTIALAVMFGLYIMQELAKPNNQPRFHFLENLPLVLYLLFNCLSVFAAKDTYSSWFQLAFLLQMFLIYIYFANMLTTPNDILYVMIFLLIGLMAEGVVVLAQKYLGLVINNFGIITVGSYGRFAGTLGSPNVAAGYFSLLLVPALALALSGMNRWIRWLSIASLCLGGVGLMFTMSRGGWTAFVVSILVFGFFLWLKGKLSPWVASILLMVVIVGITLFGSYVFTRLFGMREDAAMARLPLMKMAWLMIAANPFLGVGVNNYAMNISNYIIPELSHGFVYVVHNKYLLVWAETGLGGILTFLGFLGLSIWRGYKNWTRDIGWLSILSMGIIAAIIGQMTHMMVEIFDARSQVQALWLMAALITAISRMTTGGTDGGKWSGSPG